MAKYVWVISFLMITSSSVIDAKEKKEKGGKGGENSGGGLSDLFGQMVQNTGEVLANKAKGKPMYENGQTISKDKEMKDSQLQDIPKRMGDDKKHYEFDIFRQLEREKENKEKRKGNPKNNGKEDIEKYRTYEEGKNVMGSDTNKRKDDNKNGEGRTNKDMEIERKNTEQSYNGDKTSPKDETLERNINRKFNLSVKHNKEEKIGRQKEAKEDDIDNKEPGVSEDKIKDERNKKDKRNGENMGSAELSQEENINNGKKVGQAPFLESNGKSGKKDKKDWDSVFNMFGSDENEANNKKTSSSDRNEMIGGKEENRSKMKETNKSLSDKEKKDQMNNKHNKITENSETRNQQQKEGKRERGKEIKGTESKWTNDQQSFSENNQMKKTPGNKGGNNDLIGQQKNYEKFGPESPGAKKGNKARRNEMKEGGDGKFEDNLKKDVNMHKAKPDDNRRGQKDATENFDEKKEKPMDKSRRHEKNEMTNSSSKKYEYIDGKVNEDGKKVSNGKSIGEKDLISQKDEKGFDDEGKNVFSGQHAGRERENKEKNPNGNKDEKERKNNGLVRNKDLIRNEKGEKEVLSKIGILNGKKSNENAKDKTLLDGLPDLSKNKKDWNPNKKEGYMGEGNTSKGQKTKSNKPRQIKKKKPKQLNKEWIRTTKDAGCTNVNENAWVKYTNSSPSLLCKTEKEDNDPICICSRRNKDAKVKLLCGNCKITYKPLLVNGKKIGAKSNSTTPNKSKFKNPKKKEDEIDTNKPKSAKLESNSTLKNTKLKWFISALDSECEDDFWIADENITYRTDSPSTLCESEEETKNLICLCVKKGEKKKHVCGDCRLTYKPKRIKRN